MLPESWMLRHARLTRGSTLGGGVSRPLRFALTEKRRRSGRDDIKRGHNVLCPFTQQQYREAICLGKNSCWRTASEGRPHRREEKAPASKSGRHIAKTQAEACVTKPQDRRNPEKQRRRLWCSCCANQAIDITAGVCEEAHNLAIVAEPVDDGAAWTHSVRIVDLLVGCGGDVEEKTVGVAGGIHEGAHDFAVVVQAQGLRAHFAGEIYSGECATGKSEGMEISCGISVQWPAATPVLLTPRNWVTVVVIGLWTLVKMPPTMASAGINGGGETVGFWDPEPGKFSGL